MLKEGSQNLIVLSYDPLANFKLIYYNIHNDILRVIRMNGPKHHPHNN